MLQRRKRTDRERLRAFACRLALTGSLLGLAGCGGIDGVDFQGKMFDAVGLTGALGPKPEPKTEARSPLVLPPSGRTLPEPGSLAAAPADAAPANPAWPQDPDKTKVASADAKKKAQDAFCNDGNWREKAMQDEIGADAGPNGRCTGSLFSVLGKQLFGE
ncbi:MAG: hypothetical protein R3D67_05150 [Hyphomicrobiaceae bacterium]